MRTSRPSMIGTEFRPVSGFAWPAVADGFRPVVAGPYLRTQSDAPPAQFTFLDPPSLAESVYRLVVNVSPHLIWQMMSPAAQRPSPTPQHPAPPPAPVPTSRQTELTR